MAIKVAVAEEDQAFLRKNGGRLPDNPTPLDLYNAWKALTKKLLRNDGVTPTENVPGTADAAATGEKQAVTFTAPGTVATTTAPAAAVRDHSGELELIRAKSNLLAQQITLADRTRKIEYWRSVRAGRVAPPPRMEVTPPKQAARRVYCQLHGTTHETWPCEEVKRIAAEMKAPIPEARYVPQ